jgi:hypothetical protein
MDLRKLKTLIDLVSESNVSELEITEAEGKVRIVKGGGAMVQHYAAPAAALAPVAVAAQSPEPAVATPSNRRWWALFIGPRPRVPRPLLSLEIPSKSVKPAALLRP